MDGEEALIENVRDLDLGGYSLRLKSLEHERSTASAPVLVFLHDSLGCIETWRDFPDRLCAATGLSGLVYERRGHGNSSPLGGARGYTYLEDEADVLALVLQMCGIHQAILFGHSDGGTIALIAAARYPSLISALVAEAAHVFVEEMTIVGVKNTAQGYLTSGLREKLVRYHGDKTDALFAAWSDTWQASEFRGWNIVSLLTEVRCPVLAIQGEDDEYGSRAQVDAIASGVAGPSNVLYLPEIGHAPHREAVKRVLAPMVDFIESNIIH